MGKIGFYFDMSACIGCKTCQIACKDKNDLPIGVNIRKVTCFETGVYPNVGVYHYSGSCNHCSNPKCVKGCPTGAMHVAKDGTVQNAAEKCIGCRYCTWNCPYGHPQFNEELGKIQKCDGCKDLREAGENPVCVDACPMRALHWGNLDELKKEFKIEDVAVELPSLPHPSITLPSLLIKPRNAAFEKDFRVKDI